MIITVKTGINHDTNPDGSPRDEHCCGCYHISLDEDAPWSPYAVCNECGDVRQFEAPGIPDPFSPSREAPVKRRTMWPVLVPKEPE